MKGPDEIEVEQSNVAREFVYLINKHFPKKHTLHKVFNRNNVIGLFEHSSPPIKTFVHRFIRLFPTRKFKKY